MPVCIKVYLKLLYLLVRNYSKSHAINQNKSQGSDKFRIMVYLAETRPENYSVFVNEEPKFILAYVMLIASFLRTTYKVAKGMVILTANKI